jgi:site-specific DNA recombinase
LIAHSGIHEPIIDKALFDKVQDVLALKTRYKPLRKEFVFTGLMTCIHCGCAITAEIHKSKYVYYHCTGNRGGDCKRVYIREEHIDDQFQEILKQIKLNDEQLSWIKHCLKENHKSEQDFKKRSVASLRRQQSLIEKKLNRMYEDRLEGLISKEMWQSKSREYRDQVETISIKIQAHEKANLNYYDTAVRLLELSQRAHSLYLRVSATEKKKLLKFVCSNSQLDGKNLLVTYRKPFNMIAEGLSVYSSSPART